MNVNFRELLGTFGCDENPLKAIVQTTSVGELLGLHLQQCIKH